MLKGVRSAAFSWDCAQEYDGVTRRALSLECSSRLLQVCVKLDACSSGLNMFTCFLTWIQISQVTGQVVWYSQLFKNFPQFIVVSWPGEQSRVLSPNGREGWTPLRPLRGQEPLVRR